MRSRDEPLLKICGISTLEDGIFAHECGADIVGVILDKSVSRHGDHSLISSLTSRGIITAGVYTSLKSALSQHRDEDLIQLHFAHSPETVTRVRDITGKAVISVIQFKDTGELVEDSRRRYEAGAEIVLLENRSGIVAFKDEMERIQLKVRTGLAGKISPHNVKEIATLKPLMIDVSSSLESHPGKKDHGLVRELFRRLEVS